jgi:hypothetical protein
MTEVYEWIVNCVYDYYDFKLRDFESEEFDLKISIHSTTVSDYFIELRHKDKISVLRGNDQLTRRKMAKLIHNSFLKDFKEKETNKTKEVYEWISKCVFKLDGTHKQCFKNEKLDIDLEIYTHALTADGFDYWIGTKNKPKKVYINNNCKIAEDLVDKIYSSYITDFLTYDAMLKDPLLYTGHLNNRVHTLLNQVADKETQIDDLKRLNTSLVNHSNTMIKENVELRNEIQELKDKLESEKSNHTLDNCRMIFASHILNGNRDEKVKEFTNEYEKQIESLIKDNGQLERDLKLFQKSVNAWKEKYQKASEEIETYQKIFQIGKT